MSPIPTRLSPGSAPSIAAIHCALQLACEAPRKEIRTRPHSWRAQARAMCADRPACHPRSPIRALYRSLACPSGPRKRVPEPEAIPHPRRPTAAPESRLDASPRRSRSEPSAAHVNRARRGSGEGATHMRPGAAGRCKTTSRRQSQGASRPPAQKRWPRHGWRVWDSNERSPWRWRTMTRKLSKPPRNEATALAMAFKAVMHHARTSRSSVR